MSPMIRDPGVYESCCMDNEHITLIFFAFFVVIMVRSGGPFRRRANGFDFFFAPHLKNVSTIKSHSQDANDPTTGTYIIELMN
jgi:hypothetical protein